MKEIKLEIHDKKFSICKLLPRSGIPELRGNFYSFTKTKDELSLIVEEGYEPEGSAVESDWKMLKVLGPLDFSLTGIMSSLTKPLADNEISIFAISTFDTDYLLVKNKKLDKAIKALEKSGFVVNS